jgi:hypothetical protein
MTFKELARLTFRPMADADRDVYADVVDQDALIAYSHDETWIIEGELLRVVRVSQSKMKATQQYFILEPWGDPVEVAEL